jgi:hypothetical protein
MTPRTLIVALALLPGCLVGSGRLEERNLPLSDFDAIVAGDAFELHVAQADRYEVRVTADDNAWERVEVRRDGRTLHLGLAPQTPDANVTLRAEVTLPALARVGLSGAEQADGRLTGESLSVDCSGGARSLLTGQVRELRVEASGASHADLFDLATDRATVTLSGASNATLKVDELVSYDLSGASHLVVYGHPAVGFSHLSGGSQYVEK